MKHEIRWNYIDPCPVAIHDMRINSASFDEMHTTLRCKNGLYYQGKKVLTNYLIQISIPMSDMLIYMTKKIRLFPSRKRRYLSKYVLPTTFLRMLKKQSLEIYDIYKNDSTDSYLIKGEFINEKHYTGYFATIQFCVSKEDTLTLFFED